MLIKPLPKTPKLPNSINDDNGALLLKVLYEQFTDIATRINQLISEIDKIKKQVGIE